MSSIASRLTAHRGFAKRYPENTLASVRAALKLGLKWVEIDVQLSKDEVPLVYHDTTLRRVSGRAGDVRKIPFASLKKFPAYEPKRFGEKFKKERIASLKQLAVGFASSKGARLFVELKEESL